MNHRPLGLAFILRAIPTLIAACVITFSRDHGPVLGLVVFLSFAFLVAPTLLMTIVIVPLTGVSRTMVGVQSISTIAAGAVAAASLTGGLAALTLTMSIWAAITGAVELYAGIRCADRVVGREWTVLGVFTAIFAIIQAVLPLTDVYAVGIFGAYAMIVGLFLVIAGISLRAGDANTAQTSA